MKSLLKFITCGSVDDGKSTLIGHLLYDAKMLFTDQERALELDSRVGSRGGEIDYSLLLDGLMAEREQGITIDVAYRFFTTEHRSFIVADTPGHEQYTRNMAVGASFADLAIILVDAKQGVLVQTRRHARICALMGIRHYVLAVNKMDLIDFDQSRFDEIKDEFMGFIAPFRVDSIACIPVSATDGDNITSVSLRTAWYDGQALLPYLESIDVAMDSEHQGFILPVQRVSRPDHTFRGFQGQIETGQIQTGQSIQSLPSRETAIVKSIYHTDKLVQEAFAGQPVTVQLDREIDVSRGCVLVNQTDLQVADMLSATLLWMDESKLIVGRNYLIKIGTKVIPANILSIRHKIDVNSGKHIQTDALFKNEIGLCEIALSENVVFNAFSQTPALGEMILIDRVTNMTSACGVIEKAIHRSENIVWHATDITRQLRAQQKAQKPVTIWFTGLSGSGKSTLANALEKQLFKLGKHTMLLDGDNIRHGLNNNLGFSEADRVENIRRIAEVARLMNEAGLVVITSFISPYEADREKAREIIGDPFVEVYVSTSLQTCEERDVKGLYKKARAGQIENFTGVSSTYEVPVHPDIVADTTDMTVEASLEKLYRELMPFLES